MNAVEVQEYVVLVLININVAEGGARKQRRLGLQDAPHLINGTYELLHWIFQHETSCEALKGHIRVEGASTQCTPAH